MTGRQFIRLALCVVTLPACPPDPETSFPDLLHDQGFNVLAPPNQIHGPGAVVRIDQDGEILALICTPTESVGTGLQVNMSPTASVTFASSANGGASITGKLYDYLTADIDAKLVTELRASLTNTYDVVASEAQINDASKNRTSGCSKAIAGNLAQGLKLATITEVYLADYEFNITFSATAELNIQIQITKKLAIKLGATAAVMSANQIVGTHLYWGFKAMPMSP